jgi:hypothetical protein
MDDRELAREIIAVSRIITGAKSPFTIVRPLSLKREPAGTRVSLENARKIRDAGYMLLGGELVFDMRKADYELTAEFGRAVDGDTAEWTFGGFSFGYGGEGPRGLKEFLEIFGWGANDQKILDTDDYDQKGKLPISYFT